MREKTDLEAPTYNLKAVVRETGILPHTLRAWERRYGLPRPARTPGGHRLYSRRDIEIIRWLMARQAEGMSIGRAVALWRTLEAQGREPLRETGETLASPEGAPSLQSLRKAWIDACMRFAEEEAESVLVQAFALYPPEVVVLRLLQPALEEIGDRWYQGLATVQQEHFASALATRRLHALIAAAPPPLRSERLLIACPPGERHILPGLWVSFLLRRRGWPVVDLGADVPLLRMQEAIKAIRPRLVILTAQMLTTAASLADMADLLREMDVPVAYGGRVFQQRPSLGAYIPGVYIGELGEELPDRVEAILRGDRSPEFTPLPEVYREALARYRAVRPALEASLRMQLRAEVQEAELEIGLLELGKVIEAALRLGDPEAVRMEIEWIIGLVRHHHRCVAELSRYLKAYALGLRRHLAGDPVGMDLVRWLKASIPSTAEDRCS